MPTFMDRARVRAARRTIRADRRNRWREEATRAQDRKSLKLLALPERREPVVGRQPILKAFMQG